jgi:hypothetical protein
MKTQLERVEVEPGLASDHEFAIEHAAGRQLRQQGIDHFREVSIERFLIAALDQDLVSVSKDQHPKAIPFRLEDPCAAFRQFSDFLGEHRQDRRIYGELHLLMLSLRASPWLSVPNDKPLFNAAQKVLTDCSCFLIPGFSIGLASPPVS